MNLKYKPTGKRSNYTMKKEHTLTKKNTQIMDEQKNARAKQTTNKKRVEKTQNTQKRQWKLDDSDECWTETEIEKHTVASALQLHFIEWMRNGDRDRDRKI